MRREDSEWWAAGFTSSWFEGLSIDARKAFLDELSDEQLESFAKDWRVWARDNQLAPEGTWDVWLALAGRGWGKTRTAVETTNDAIERGIATRIAIVGQGEDDIRKVMIEGRSGFLATARSDRRPIWSPSNGTLEWPNGAVGFVYSAMDTEGLRGPEFDWGWFDEPMAVPAEFRERAMSNLEFCLRLPPHPRLIITTTPKPHRWLREQMAQADKEKDVPLALRSMIVTRGTTSENRANLAKSFYKRITGKYEGTQLGRQELDGELLGEEAGALWTAEGLDKTRVRSNVKWSPEESAAFNEAARLFGRGMEKRVIGVDPNAVTASNHAAGIIPVGRFRDGRRYALGDWSAKNKSPAEWAKDVLRCYAYFDADEIVAEVNNGGEMVRDIVRQAAKDMKMEIPPIVMEHAKRDKIIRATPMATAYQLRTAGNFGECGSRDRPGPLYLLETQMTSLHDGYDGTGEDFDRVDALVWGMRRLGRDVDSESEGGGSGMKSFDQLAGAA